jgi:hypothetical protein
MMHNKLAPLQVDMQAFKEQNRESVLGKGLRNLLQWLDRYLELGDWWQSRLEPARSFTRLHFRRRQKLTKQDRRNNFRSNLGSMIESLELRAMFAVDLGIGDIAFTGYQSTAPDKVSFVLLKNVDSGTVLTITDNAWTGTALQTTEGNSVLTFGGTFNAGTQFNYDATRTAGLRWAVGSTTTSLSDTTGTNFALNASGDNLFAYNGTTAPTTGNDAKWVSAVATNSFLTTGSASASLTYLPSAFTLGTTALSLGLANAASNQNGALTTPPTISGNVSSIQSTVYTIGNWTTFTTVGGQAIPSATTFSFSGNGNPTMSANTGTIVANGGTVTISQTQLQATDAEQTSPASLVFTVTTLPVNGQLRKSGVALALNGTFTQADINSNLITYLHSGGSSTSDSFGFNLSDGAGGSLASQSFAITVSPKILLSEIKVNPPGSTTLGNRYQHIELRGAPGTSLNNIYVGMFDGNGTAIGSADYVISLAGQSLGTNGLLVIKSPTSGHSVASGTTVVTDNKFDSIAGGVLSKQSVSFYLAAATSPLVEGSDYDINDDGTLDSLPAGFAVLDNVGWLDEDVGDRVYGGVSLTQNQGTPDAATRFLSDNTTSTAAWFNGDLFDIGNDPAQLLYDTTRTSSNFPSGSATPRITPGGVNFSQAPTIAVNAGLTVMANTADVVVADSLLRSTDTEQSASQLFYRITTLPSAGILKINGANVVANSTTFTQSDIVSNLLTIDAPATAGNYSFSFTVGDGYSTTAGSFQITVNPTPVNSTLRIANYNLAASGDDGIPRTGLITLLEAFGNEVYNSISRAVDLFIFQEVKSQLTTTQYIVDQLNGVYGTGTYGRGSVNGNSTGAGTLGVAYNTNTLQLLSEVPIGVIGQVTRQSMRYLFRPIGGVGNSDFYVYANHLKASDTNADEQQRLQEVTYVRNDANGLGDGKNIIYAGDLNVYSSSDLAFQALIGAGNGQPGASNGQAFDPLNRLGNWSGTNSFRDIFTQAPSSTPIDGMIGGGLDDRFDFQLLTGEFTDGNGLEYRPNSYRTFGNNGSVAMNSSINAGSNTALASLPNRTTVLNLLTTVSDHLPVIADYSFPTSTNSAPVLNPQSFTIAENLANGSSVGTVVSSDPDVGDTRVFTITGGNSLGAFTIGNGGVITVADASKLDYETVTSFPLTVRVTDSGSLFASATITINLTNVVEPPIVPPRTFLIAENLPGASVVGTVTATADFGRTISTFAITAGNGTGGGAFAISNSGVITVADTTQLNFETVPGSQFTLTVRATDSLGLSSTASVIVNLTDVYEGTNLSPGDLVITGINADDNDEFTFVPLVNLIGGTIIRFTDNGWLSTGAFRTGEGLLRYTAPTTGIAAGTKIGIVKNATGGTISFTAPSSSQGTIVEEPTTNGFSLATTGDQLIAFQGELASPTLVFALTTFRNAFDADATNASTSALPVVLANGTSAIAIGTSTTDFDNGEYNHSVTTGSVTQLRSSAANVAAWNRNDTRIAFNYNNFTLQTGTAPSFVLSSYTFSIPENSLSGASIGSATATDPDVGATLAYSLSGTGSSNFAINSATGAITIGSGAILDFETTPTFVLSASVTDGTYNVSVPVTINLTDVTENAAPTAVSLTPNSLSLVENTSVPSNLKVSDITITDDGLGTNTLFLSGTDADFFTIIGNVLYLKAGTTLNFENKSTYSVTVNVDDATLGSTPDASASFTLTVTDDTNENRLPVIAPQSFVINSKASVGGLVGVVQASDPDAGQGLTYEIVSGNSNATFIIETSGAIRVANPTSLPAIPKGQTSTSVVMQVRVSDSGSPSANATAAVTITLSTTGRMAPIVNPVSLTIAENNSKTDGTTKVGSLKPLAAYSGQKFLFSTTLSGPDASSFRIDAAGNITLAPLVSLNYETRDSYQILVTVADSLDATKTTTTAVSVIVKDLNEAPVYELFRRDPVTESLTSIPIVNGKASFSIEENEPSNLIKNALVVGIIGVLDVDDGTVLSLQKNAKGESIVLDKTGAFALDLATGEIRVADETKLSFESRSSVTLSFSMVDTPIAGDSKSKAITTKLTVVVNLNDMNEAPVFSGPSTFTIAENNKAGAKVGSVKAVDADKTKQTLTYSIVSQKNAANADVTIFTIDPTSGAITVSSAGALDYEASVSYALLVRVTDNGSPNLAVDQPVTVNVTDLNEVATFVLQDALNAPASLLSITGSSMNGDKLGRLLINDPDAGDAGGYTAGSIASALVAASKGALTYNETNGDITIFNKGLLTKSTSLKVTISDRSIKKVKSTVTIQINVSL